MTTFTSRRVALFRNILAASLLCGLLHISNAQILGDGPDVPQADIQVAAADRSFSENTEVTSVAFSSDEKAFAVGSQSLSVYDVPNNKKLFSSPASFAWITNVVFSDDGRFVAIGRQSTAMAIQIFDATTGALKHTIPLSNAPTALVAVPNAQKLLVQSSDKTFSLVDWDGSEQAQPVHEMSPDSSKHPAYAMRFSPDGQHLICAGGGIGAKEATGTGGAMAAGGTMGTMTAFAWSGTTEGEVCVWDWQEKSLLMEQIVDNGSCNCAISPDGKDIAFTGGWTSFNNLKKGGQLQTTDWEMGLIQIAVAPLDPKEEWAVQLKVGDPRTFDGSLSFGLGAATDAGVEVLELGMNYPLLPTHALSFSPNNTLAVPSTRSSLLALWNGKERLGQSLLQSPARRPSVTQWSPSGHYLASASKKDVFLLRAGK